MSGITRREQINRRIGEGVSKKKPEVIAKLKEAFAFDCTVEEACCYAEIAFRTYYNWIKADPKLLQEFDRLRHKPVLKARSTVVNSLGTPEYAFRYLEKKRPEEFGNKSKIELAGKVQTEDVTQGSPEAVKAVVERFEQELRSTIAKVHGK